jgi:DNA-directed RNA polymerase III subunit RPC1
MGIIQSIATRHTRGLLPFEIMESVDRELSKKKFTTECTPAYLATLRGFIAENIAQRLAAIRKSHGMFEAIDREEEWDENTDLSMGASSKQLLASVL